MKKLRVVLVCMLLLLAVYAVAVVAAEVVEGEELSAFATVITTFLAGTLGVWLVQGLKRILPWGLGDRLMTYIAYVVAFVVSILAFTITGGFREMFTSPWTVIQNLITTGGFMTLAYATLKGKLGIAGKSQLKRR